MKYPQLVSTRAVNAISDWLVSRLEQLGVEAPLIYSRLLLSLLQSSVQLNDPIEFSNLETFLANRKGNSKRYPPCDTDTLKKIAAVQCLMDIVSSEQEITKIENLVDELCEKVNDIEKQSSNIEGDDDLQIAALALNSVLTTPSSSFNTANGNNNNKTFSTAIETTTGKEENFGNSGHSTTTTTAKLSTEITLSVSTRKTKEQTDAEDPRKRYYRAFPALSKEMEDSIVLLRRNTKSLTWPVDRKINSSNKIATNSTAAATAAATAASTVAVVNSNKCASLSEKIRNSPSALLGNSQKGDSNTVLCNTAGVKRKTKRRRNQAMSKGKTAAGNNTRKNSYCGGSSSPTWDTDFEGSWEMGRDLIKEFIVKQNNRNRSTSESAAYNMAQGSGGGNNNNGARDGGNANEIYEKRMKPMLKEAKIKQDPMSTKQKTLLQKQHQKQEQKQENGKANNNNQMTKLAAETGMVETSLCDDIVDNSRSDDTLASVSDITEGNMNTARRLYERDISNDSLYEQSTHDYHSNNHKQSLSASSSEQLDFAQFKAKFNSSVEALWKNSNSSDNSNNNLSKSMLHSSIITDSSVSVAPYLSENLKNFWTNYYSHHFDVDKFKQLNCNDCCDYSMTTAATSVGNSFHSDVHSDYFSMPTVSSGVDEFDKSVGGKRAGGKTSPIGVFLQNTIWSENSNASYPDTDESFFIKALKSSTCTSQKSHDQFKMDISGGDKSYYYPYQTSKWSEGINGVPHNNASISLPQHQSNQQPQPPLIITSSSSSSSISTMDHSARSCYTNDLADSTPSSTSSYFGSNANWQIPTGNNLQADVKSWSSSNPTSLAELYGAGSNNTINNNNVTLGKKNSSHFDRNAAASGITSSSNASSITLANHSPTCSGFIAYSRIKSYVKLIDSKPIAKWQKPEAEYHQHLSTASDDDDDDENLLNSERTHFHPIKMSYADGHTFEISSNLDPVDFERSDSGYLYLESEKYLEYIRSDTLSEDDGSVAGHFHRTDSVASRECTSSVASSTRSSHSEFVIRFRLRTTDKACQTESNLIIPNVIRSSLVYQMASAHLPRPQKQAAHSNSTNDDDDDEDDWMDIGCGSTNIRGDEDDYVSMDQWSMAEIGRKCIDNNNSSHTLWGMCPACNNDMKSIPANRLLKAELNMEGDEIMSDLRYMQDLYIGSDWDDQNGTREGGGGDDDDTDLDAETIRDCEFYHAMATPAGCGEIEEEDQQQKEDMLYNVNKLIADLLRPENAQTLANALGAVGVGVGLGVGVGVGCLGVVGAAPNQNIFGAEKNNLAVEQLNTMNDEKYIGGLWNSDENIIWKKEFNPIDIFSRLNNNNNDSFLEKLNWEYSNLAEIWGKASPNNTGLTTDNDCPAELDSVSVKTNEEICNKNNNSNNNTKSVTLEDEESIKIACKNIKNLLKSSSIPPPAAHYKISKDSREIFEMNESLLNDCKQMQCFLNSNKFKISNRIDRKRRHSASQNVCCNSNNNNFVTNHNNNSNNNNTIYDNNNLKLSPFGSALNPSQSTTVATGTATAKAKVKAAITTTTTQTKATTKDTLSDYGRNTLKYNVDDGQQEHGLIQHYNNNNNNDDDDDDDNDDDDDQQQQQHANNSHATIITCKYWTTMHPIINGEGEELSGDDNSFDAQAAAASFFIDKSQFIDGLSSITLNTSSILKHVTLVSRPLTR